MEFTYREVQIKITRKEHKCISCGVIIPTGSPAIYACGMVVDEGSDFGDFYLCKPCHAVINGEGLEDFRDGDNQFDSWWTDILRERYICGKCEKGEYGEDCDQYYGCQSWECEGRKEKAAQ